MKVELKWALWVCLKSLEGRPAGGKHSSKLSRREDTQRGGDCWVCVCLSLWGTFRTHWDSDLGHSAGRNAVKSDFLLQSNCQHTHLQFSRLRLALFHTLKFTWKSWLQSHHQEEVYLPVAELCCLPLLGHASSRWRIAVPPHVTFVRSLSGLAGCWNCNASFPLPVDVL